MYLQVYESTSEMPGVNVKSVGNKGIKCANYIIK